MPGGPVAGEMWAQMMSLTHKLGFIINWDRSQETEYNWLGWFIDPDRGAKGSFPLITISDADKNIGSAQSIWQKLWLLWDVPGGTSARG